MRFALLKTKNNAGLIDALGAECDIIDESQKVGTGDLKFGESLLEEIHAIAERNVTRRKIRFPTLFNSAMVAALYRTIYRRRAIAKYRAIHALLKRDTDRCVLVFNGYLAPNALLDLAARELNLKRLFLENGFFPKTMQCDPRGINALSSLPREASFYDRLNKNDAGANWPTEFAVRQSKLKDGATADAPDNLPANFVFVPFQVPSDMQILALSPWIRDMEHLHAEVVALAAAFPDRQFVIKEHPSFPISIQSKVSKHKQILFRNGDTTRDLIERSDAVLTVNSTVGLEALASGKKVVTLGEAHYAIDGLVLRAGDRQALHDAFSSMDAWRPNNERREKFVRFAYNQFLLPLERTAPGDNALKLLKDRAHGNDSYMLLIGQK